MFGEALIWYLNSVVAFWRGSPANLILMLIMVSLVIRMLCGRRRGWWAFRCCCRCGCGCHGAAGCCPDCGCPVESDGEEG